MSDSSTFGSIEPIVLKSDMKKFRIVSFGANLTHFGAKSGHCDISLSGLGKLRNSGKCDILKFISFF